LTAPPPIVLALDAVILAVTEDAPRVLTIAGADGLDALPSGTLDLERHPTLERGLRDWVEHHTGLELGYVEQLYTFGDRHRDPRDRAERVRVISAAYLALVREQGHSEHKSRFCDVYRFLPWEDWRDGRPALIDVTLKPLLRDWAGSDRRRRERIDLTFGLDGAPWDPERTLERYELLWETGLVAESGLLKRSTRRRAIVPGEPERRSDPPSGLPMARDHRRMLATALGRVRGKLKYRPVVFELLPAEFTLLQLQRTVEALAGARLHKQNFRRLVETAGLVEHTGRFEHAHRGRPAELFRFRHEVFRERPAPGVYFPGAWWAR
jgi:hypothetical protein